MDKTLFKTICNELIDTVKKNIFPADAKFVPDTDIDTGNYVCHISWVLSDDKDRLAKPSRTIKVIITDEAITFSNYPQKKDTVQTRFKNLILKHKENFNPNHNEPKFSPPPLEEWLITNKDLNQ